VISFSYDINNLNKGIMFSLSIEKSTVIYLDKDALFTRKIDFVDALLQIVRFVDRTNTDGKAKYNNPSRKWYAKIMDMLDRKDLNKV